MIRAEQIPPEAWDKICEAFDVKPSEARAALAAALNAWPGMDTRPNIYGRQDAILILPLTENTNAKG